MNLTDEQKDLLRMIVSVYVSGDKSQFIVSRTHQGTSLCYSGGHAPISIDSDYADFLQLADEKLVTLAKTTQGSLSGKPTRLGIQAVETDFSALEQEAPVVTEKADPRTLQSVLSFLERNKLDFEVREIQFGAQIVVQRGPLKARVNVYNTGTIQVQTKDDAIGELLSQMKTEMVGGEALPGRVLPFEIDRFPVVIQERIPNCDPVIVRFIQEAISCYKSEALLATAFMLGAASERAVSVLIQTYAEAITDEKNREKFRGRINGRMISNRYEEFLKSYGGCKSKPTDGALSQDLDVVIGGMFQFCRITRNEVGHPQIVPDLDRGVILANLAHFVTYIERIYGLIQHFQEHGVVV